MDDETTTIETTQKKSRTRTIVALSIAAAIAVSAVSNYAWAAAHPGEPVFELSQVFAD